MSTFTDAKGRPWTIALNIGSMKKIKEKTGFDFLSSDENTNPILKIAANYILLADVVWCLVEEQATAKGVSVEDFVESLIGDPLDKLIDAIAEAYVGFTPNPQRRQVLTALWAKVRETEKTVLEQAQAKLDETPTLGS